MPYEDANNYEDRLKPSYGEKPDLYGQEDPGPYWHHQLDEAQKTFDKWMDRGKKVVRRYRDERDAIEWPRTKFNILWSNIQVLQPSLYGSKPKPEVSRRYMDADPVGRVACTILERVLEYEVEQFHDFDSTMRSVVEDRLLPGRGVAWVRYDPTIENQPMPGLPQDTSLEAGEGASLTNVEPDAIETITEAHSPVDYVYWQDFLHNPARTWDEVWWVSRWVYMTREEGIARFGEIFKQVGLSSQNADQDSRNSIQVRAAFDKKAKVAEIWNKRTGKVCWIAEGFERALDERDDPLGLEGFFPCPKPLYATITNGSLIPVPDYCEYEDQATELDNITNRITMLVKAVKAVGVFNAEYKELGRLFTEGIDNKMFPVVSWAALSEKGGLKGAVDMLDISGVLQALNQLYQSREMIKQTIYEICGISDILRGSSQAEETLGAQQIKAQFGSLRLKSSQTEVARIASDIFSIKAQIICKFYPPELIVQMSGILNTPEGMNQQMVGAAVQMLQNSTLRDFHISVESDSLAQIDELSEKQNAVEAVTAISQFLQSSAPLIAQQPETLPMAGEMLLFLVRRFRAGRGLESAIERAMMLLQQKAANATQQQQPSPEEKKAQIQAQAKQAEVGVQAQLEQARIQAEMQMEALKFRQHQMTLDHQKQIAMMQQAQEERFKRWEAELDSRTKLAVAQIQAHTQQDRTAQETARVGMKIASEGHTPPSVAVIKGE